MEEGRKGELEREKVESMGGKGELKGREHKGEADRA